MDIRLTQDHLKRGWFVLKDGAIVPAVKAYPPEMFDVLIPVPAEGSLTLLSIYNSRMSGTQYRLYATTTTRGLSTVATLDYMALMNYAKENEIDISEVESQPRKKSVVETAVEFVEHYSRPGPPEIAEPVTKEQAVKMVKEFKESNPDVVKMIESPKTRNADPSKAFADFVDSLDGAGIESIRPNKEKVKTAAAGLLSGLLTKRA
jgi:hypothetical protein